MNSLFPLPLYNLLKLTSLNGGISRGNWRHLLPWGLKTTLLEPLRWVELAAYHKRIRQHSITAPPLFILGYYRSGTTYLQQLFMQDDRLGHTSAFQMIFPEIMLGFERSMTPMLERVSRSVKMQNPIHRIPFTWHSPGEEDVAMTTLVSPVGAQWGFFFPRKMKDYFERYVLFENTAYKECERWKQTYLLLLKKISLANRCKPLVLKSPPNTARIQTLLSLFPNAKFLFIHRNPYEVYASNKRLWQVIQDHYSLGSAKSTDYKTIILETYSRIMDRYLLDKSLVPPGRLYELSYEEFIKEPVECLEQVYNALELGSFGHVEEKVRAFAERQKTYKVMHHNLPPEEFKRVSEYWEPYLKQWRYPVLQEGPGNKPGINDSDCNS